MKKVIVDIGGTKTFISLMEEGKIRKLEKFETPRERRDLLNILSRVFKYSNEIKTINVAIAGRYQNNKVILSPNIPLLNFNLKDFFRTFENVNIENDTLCGVCNLLNEGVNNALLINWGTGIGGAIIIDGKIYRGMGKAGEIGHVRLIKGDWEDLLGGKSFVKKYGMDGVLLQKMAINGNKDAINALYELGKGFGEFLVSMIYILDPEIIVLYGGVINSWNFMKNGVKEKLREFRMKNKIRVIKDRYYTLRGCYYIDEI
ncbi:MAG: ROK family protein [Thermoplasmata archaeon]